MRRVAAPDIKRIEGYEDEKSLKIVRQYHPSHWLLSEFLFHLIILCLEAYEKVSARMLLGVGSVVPTETDLDIAFQKNTPFTRTYRNGADRNQALYNEWEKNVSDEEKASWEKMSAGDRATAYLKRRDDDVPQYQVFIDVGKFLFGEYRHLADDLRAVIDLAFSGFIFTALNSPDFPSLCKSKNLDVSAMTFDQKLDAELDHEAFYNALLARLGHA